MHSSAATWPARPAPPTTIATAGSPATSGNWRAVVWMGFDTPASMGAARVRRAQCAAGLDRVHGACAGGRAGIDRGAARGHRADRRRALRQGFPAGPGFRRRARCAGCDSADGASAPAARLARSRRWPRRGQSRRTPMGARRRRPAWCPPTRRRASCATSRRLRRRGTGWGCSGSGRAGRTQRPSCRHGRCVRYGGFRQRSRHQPQSQRVDHQRHREGHRRVSHHALDADPGDRHDRHGPETAAACSRRLSAIATPMGGARHRGGQAQRGGQHERPLHGPVAAGASAPAG